MARDRREDQEEMEVVEEVIVDEDGNEVEQIEIDPVLLERYMRRLEDEQNFPAGVFAGLVAAAAGAGIWAGVTYATNTKLGLIALLIGFLVGHAVRIFGKGIHIQFRVAGAILALLGCIAGNVLMIAIYIYKSRGIPVMSLITNMKFITAVLSKTGGFDFLFYAIALYEGYQFSPRTIDEEDLIRATRR